MGSTRIITCPRCDEEIQVEDLLWSTIDQQREEIIHLLMPQARVNYMCGCTDVSACEQHAGLKRYGRCAHCASYHISAAVLGASEVWGRRPKEG
ncbi:MAG: hypothetical protein ACR2KS_10245 [Candidatus Eremiobacter antarcticus]|nr:hypothetical protein [Candidatus Eremiobacteraeota bacterium]MBC5808813.1 hypothetical protein [Candidatus Eremiobacteraeota bacterium]